MSGFDTVPPISENPEPALNVPGSVALLAAACLGVHLVRVFALSPAMDYEILLLFSFLPIRYDAVQLAGAVAPGGAAADAWTFVTYAFLHGGWSHIIFNLLWLVVFGSAVARRFGAGRFFLIFLAGAIGGAGAHLLTHFGEAAPMIGASAGISALMAAASRFVFEMGGPLGAMRLGDDERAYRMPAVGLARALSNPQVLIFLAVWFGVNLIFGLSSAPIAGEGATIAWQAHIGGFIVGLLLFPLFDPVPRRRTPE